MPPPLAETLQRVKALDSYLGPRLLPERGPGPEWVSLEALTADLPALAGLLARAGAHYGAKERQSPAALWFGEVFFSLIAFPSVSFLTERRVPAMAPDDLWLHLDEHGQVAAAAWTGRRFSALPGDPAAGHADCVPVETLDDLRTRLREGLLARSEPLMAAVHSQSALGRPGLWALAADTLASTFVWAGGLAGDEALGADEARQVAAPSPRLRRKRDFLVIEHAGHSHHLVDRLSCCLYYRVEGGEFCTSCPHRPREERIARYTSYLEQKGRPTDVS